MSGDSAHNSVETKFSDNINSNGISTEISDSVTDKNAGGDRKANKDAVISDVDSGEKQTEENDSAAAIGNKVDEWEDILGSGCIMRKCLRPGSDKRKPVRGDRCQIRVSGRLVETDRLVDDHQSLTMTIGERDVVNGIDLSLCLMEVGEISQLKISDRFAYGSHGREPDVPPHATIIYEVELIDILGPLDVTKLSVDEKLTIGDSKRNKGNTLYTEEEYNDAVMMYNKAISVLDDYHNMSGVSEDKLQEVLDLRIKCYNNLAAAQLKMEAYAAALKSCDTVLKCQPKNVKALFRKGKVLGLQGNLNPAIKILREALTLEPETKIIHQELSRLVARQRKEEEKEKAMYRRMFAGSGADGGKQSAGRSKPDTSSSMSKWGVLGAIGAAATVLTGIILYKYL